MKHRLIPLGLIVLFLAGCATTKPRTTMLSQDDVALGYRIGVQENINKFAENFIGNDFPYYYWQGPLIQRVYIPAHVRGGCFIPAHYEYVILDPAEWRETYGYPITSDYPEETEK